MAKHAPTTPAAAPASDAPHTTVPSYPPTPIVDLARRHRTLRELKEAVEHTEHLHRRQHPEIQNCHGTLMVPGGACKQPTPLRSQLAVIRARELDAAGDALDDECDAIEELIVTAQAATLPDAAAQLLVVVALLDSLMDHDDDDDRRRRWCRFQRALEGSAKVVAREAGMTLRDLSGGFFASKWRDNAPDLTKLAGLAPVPFDPADLVADEPLPAAA